MSPSSSVRLKNRSAVALFFGAVVKKWGRPAVEVEQAILDEGERVANDLRRYLRRSTESRRSAHCWACSARYSA